jgi:D-serine deaminase-like pyridoxal phosphate-dependent protein
MVTNLFSQIDRPILLLDEEKAKRNIRRMKVKADRLDIFFRPHFKTHQSEHIGEWFREEEVTAITVSSVAMAQYFADHGWRDITIAFTVNWRQMDAIMALAERVQLGLLVESQVAVDHLAANLLSPVDIWMKVDTGAHRTGISWDEPEVFYNLANKVQSFPQFNLRGLLTHAGQTYHAGSTVEVCRVYEESVGRVTGLRNALAVRGVAPLDVSVGDTPGCTLSHDLGTVQEIRPGNFVFFDAMQHQLGTCGTEDIAVALACPVVAKHPARHEVVIYGGAVHLSKDYYQADGHRSYGLVALPQEDGWGPSIDGAFVARLSQEHGIVHMENGFNQVNEGDLLCIYPAHSCLTVTLMKEYLTLSGDWISTLN